MQISQQASKLKIVCRASFRQRVGAGLVFLAVFALFGLLGLAAAGKIDMGSWFGPCGFKQKYDLPCPTCGITTSALAFVQGRILESFYIQPTAALMCCILVVIAVFAFFTGVCGVYFRFLKRFFAQVRVKYIILTLVVIVAAGWVVTLARALATR
jgi:hypothetical protein